MKYVVLNLSEAKTKDDIHDIIVRELAAPDYYGRNLDALHDVLTSQKEDIAIDIDGQECLADDLKEYVDRIQKVIKAASDETAGNSAGRVLSVDVLAEDGEE